MNKYDIIFAPVITEKFTEFASLYIPLKFLSKTLDWIVENPIDEKNDIDIKIIIKYILLFLVFFTFIF